MKAWCFPFGLLPRLLWPLQVYEVTMTRVETMERSIRSYRRKWLGVPRTLTSVALYSSSVKFQLQMTSLLEERKVTKARLYMMLRDSVSCD